MKIESGSPVKVMNPTILNHTVTFMHIFKSRAAKFINIRSFTMAYKSKKFKITLRNRRQYAENNSGNPLWYL